MTAPLPVLYDFSVEKEILKKKNTEDSLLSTIIAKNKVDITQNLTSYQKSILQKMKNITNASQERCVSILMQTNFKLNESIEAYYRGN
jgi:tagatose-1,6-bisphosphate aldolase